MRRLLPFALASLLFSSLTGCLSQGAETPTESPRTSPGLAPDAVEPTPSPAGSASQGPIAPKEAFAVGPRENRTTIHPYAVPGQKARPSESITLEGKFEPQDCTTLGASWIAGNSWQAHDLTSKLAPGDAVDATVTLTFKTTEASFASLHLFVGAPGHWYENSDDLSPTSPGEQVQNWSLQFGFPGREAGEFIVGAGCWWATNVQAIPYTIEVRLSFSEGVIPAGTPHLVRVSENVRELRVAGVPAAPDGTVSGHYRLFGPDDKLVGAFALNSGEAFDGVRIEKAGDYVLIVDHAEGGMLAIGADAPPEDPVLQILRSEWGSSLDYAPATPGPVETSFTVNFPRVPLAVFPWVRAQEGSVAYAKKVVLDIDGPAGRLWHLQIASHVGIRKAGTIWLGFGTPSPDDWAFEYDHHALAEGDHTFTLKADFLQGEVYHWFITYLRPGEEGPPAPTASGGGGALPPPLRALRALPG